MKPNRTATALLAALAAITINPLPAEALAKEGASVVHAADKPATVPIGHADFVPTPERPIGFRGDGSGNYEGATPPIEWWDGTPVKKEVHVTGDEGPIL